MVIKRPEPEANIRPHVVPKAKKSEGIRLYMYIFTPSLSSWYDIEKIGNSDKFTV